MVPITSFIFQDGNKAVRSDLFSESKSKRGSSPKKNARKLNDTSKINEYNMNKKQIGSGEQISYFTQGKSLDRNTAPQGYSSRKNKNSQIGNISFQQQNQPPALRQYELNYQRLLKYKQYLDEMAKEKQDRQNGKNLHVCNDLTKIEVQNLLVVHKKNPEERFEIPPKYIKISRERSEDKRFQQMNESLQMNSSFKQTIKIPYMVSSRIQSPTSPFKAHFDINPNSTTIRGFSQIDNRKTPPQTHRYNIPKILIQTQQSKTLEEDAGSPQSNYSTRLNQLMPKIAPKKMNDDHSSSSPNKNTIRFAQSSSKRHNQTQGIESAMDDQINGQTATAAVSSATTTINANKQANTINFNNQLSNTFYKPKQQIQLDNFMREIQEQSLGLKKMDLIFDNNYNSKNKTFLQNARTPSSQQNSQIKQEYVKSFKSATPNTLDSTNRQNIRINQMNKTGLRDLVRPYTKQPYVIYDESELFSVSRNGSPESKSQKKNIFSNSTKQGNISISNNLTINKDHQENIQQNQNDKLPASHQNITNQVTHTSNFLQNDTNQKTITNNLSSLQDRHIFSEKEFNLQIRESKIPLLKSLLNSEGSQNQSALKQTGFRENYDAQYHERKMEQNLKLSVITSQDQKNGLNILHSKKNNKAKNNRFNYGILEIGSLSTNFDVALQDVKMENLFMVEEYTFDALKFVKENFKVRKICKLYLKHTNDNNYIIIQGIFKDKKILLNYKKLIIFERIVILVLLLFTYTPQQPMPLDIQVLLKNLCYYIHNNSTLLIELLLDIFTQTKKLHPNWEKLTEIFHLRLKKPNSADKNEIVDLILQNNNQIETLFDQLKSKYNYEFMKHLNRFKDEAMNMENLEDSLVILSNSTQDILNTMNENKKTQQKTQYKEEYKDEEYQNNFRNIEDYIKYEQKNKVIISNDYQIDDDEEGEEDEDDDEQLNDSGVNSNNSLQYNDHNNIGQRGNQKKKMTSKQGQKKTTSIKEPFLPEINPKYKYTLVLDLDETLVHYHEMEDQQGGEFLIRPFAEQFIKEMSKLYEVVIFTAAVQEYADWILDIIDQDKNISYKLYRHHTVFDGQYNIKDLSKLGRNIGKTIIIDNLPENFSKQPENGIFIQSWFGEKDDKALFDLSPLLKQIVEKESADVRIALRKFSDQIEENIRNGLQYPHLNLIL